MRKRIRAREIRNPKSRRSLFKQFAGSKIRGDLCICEIWELELGRLAVEAFESRAGPEPEREPGTRWYG